jgi:[histone H3]-trimethyl-L-lysine4 demethylase
MFTCPICDWRVKIPRDAARPKLEDLQGWQDEVVDLPFQPEEEELLRRIVNKAQAFRDFLAQYTNGNQICRTIDEMPEMLFYLRKIEGAEVLLAYETNLFRQELHKWQPIAPEPPPILAHSLSTRKPRPTKQQKLMKELGVQRPEDLPPHLRTKTYTRRKTQDGMAASPGGTLMPKMDDSPAPGSASSPGGAQARSATPSAMPRQASTGNVPGNNVFDPALINGRTNQFDGNYGPHSPSPMFSPTGEQGPDGMRDPMMTSGLGGPRVDPRNHDLSFPSFQPAGLGMDNEDDIRNGLAIANADNGPSGPGGASPHDGDYVMFMDMNQDEAGGAGHDNPVPSLEQEASHASEALDVMGGGNDDDEGDELGETLGFVHP